MGTSAATAPFGPMWKAAAAPHDGTPRASLVPIATGTGIPLFFVHWAPGVISFINVVADAFRHGRPVYGFESMGIAERRRPLISVSEITARYLAEMREVQPHGPYFIAGLCSGSSVAFEMARQITESGDSVAALVLLRSLRPGTRQLESGCGIEDIYHMRLESLRHEHRADLFDKDLPGIMPVLKPRGLIDVHAMSDDDFYWQQAVFAANFFAQENYEPRMYTGPAHVFHSLSSRDNEASDWTPVAPKARTSLMDLAKCLEIMTTPEFAAAVAPQEEP